MSRAAMTRALQRAVAAGCLLICTAVLANQAAADPSRAALALREGEPVVRAALLAHPDDLGADNARIGVHLEVAPGWHIYGAEAGETGLPTQLTWSVDDGAVEASAWPATETFSLPELGLGGAGYTGRVLLPGRARGVPEAATLRARVELLACRDECIPAEAELALALAQAPRGGAAAERVREAFAGGAEATGAAGGFALQAARALALALLGGLILNLMPCVLPVLAIKALALAELGTASRATARRQALAYAAGVQASLLALAGVVSGLRTAGLAVGWGFQFQEPAYVAGLGALLVLFALNLFGVFEITASPSRLASLGAETDGARRSFFDGLLTVALATPCSAPFLGTAVGFALAGDGAWIFPVFGAVGVGLAFPLALIGANPACVRWLPRPGPWMQELRALLGFGLLGTVVWLGWILGRTANVDVAARWLAWLLLVACLAWRFGLRQQRGRPTSRWLAAGAAGVLLLLGAGAVRTERAPATAAPTLLAGTPWSRAAVSQALDQGRPAFVYFTADWCITCKANEKLVLRDPRIADALAAGEFAVFVGDWTRRDADIAQELARYGRAGVPFYAVLAPEARAQLLPELLSVDGVLSALRSAEHDTRVSRITRAAHAAPMQRERGSAAGQRRPRATN